MGLKGYGSITVTNVNRGVGFYTITTAPSSSSGTIDSVSYSYKINLNTALTQSGASEIFVGDNLRYSYYLYPVCYVDSTYVYCTARTNIRGAQGESGKGISSTSITYQKSTSGTTAPTGTWISTIPEVGASEYLWTKTEITYTDNTKSTSYSVGMMGQTGEKGDTGVGIASITQHYLATDSSSGVTTSTSGWTTSVQTVTASKRYLWNYETIKYTNNSTVDTDPCIIGTYGDTGKGISSVTEHYLATSAGSDVTKSTSGWSTSIQTITVDKRYLWNYETITYTNGSTADTTPVIIGVYGNTGTSITSVTEHYLATSASSGVTKSTSGWSTSIQTMTATNKYLWNYETINYSSGSSSDTTPVIIGAYGDKGKDGTNAYTHIRYSKNSDGSSMTTDPEDAVYIGVYTGTSSTAPTSASSYTWSKFKGDTGASGNGINSISYYYATTTNQTAPAASSVTSTTIPTMSATNKYLWQKEVIDFTDSSVSDKTTVVLIAVYGNTGGKGDAGTSITIKSTSVTYQASTSGTITPTGTWETSVPNVEKGQYLWTKTVVTYSDNTSTTAYSVAYKGTDGEKGDTGVGISSITYYYTTSTTQTAPSASSITSTTIPTLSATNKYLWQKETIKLTDNSTKDTVALIAVYGDKGIGISAIKTQYYLSTSNTAQSGGSWVDTCPAYVDSRYYWTRSHITWTDTSTSTTTAVLNNALTTASKNALDALTELDNMEIGGVNYLSLKECMHTSSLTKYGITVSPPDDDGWFYVSGTTTARTSAQAFDLWNPKGSYTTNGYTAINHLTFETGDIITITVEVRGTAFVTGTDRTTSTFVQLSGKTNEPFVTVGGFADNVTTYTISTTFPYVGRIVYYYGKSAATGVTLDGSFRIKIEKGNQSTDWSPSPFDVDSDIANAQTSADQALQNTDNLGTDLSNLSNTVDGLSNDLTSKTSDLETKYQDALQQIQENYQAARAYADSILRDYQAEVNQYMQFTSDTGLTLGAQGSSFKTVHDNQGMYFKENDATVAYVTNKQLYIPDAVIENTLALGKFAFVPHNDGGVSLIWTGDE